MTQKDVIATLARLGLQPSRRLGQNFLVDTNLLAALVRAAAPQPGEQLLEIGPGLGGLTDHLLGAGARVTAIELDLRLADYLRQNYAGVANLRLIQADACDVDYDSLMGPDPYRCVANLPYSVSTVVIMRLLEAHNPPAALFILLQKEMALRLAAAPRTPEYGGISIVVQWHYEVSVLRRVPPSVFLPPPEVESAFVRFSRRPTPMVSDELRPTARELVRLGFSQRRKQMFKRLASRWPEAALHAAYAALGLPADVRAEALTPRQFAAFAALLPTT